MRLKKLSTALGLAAVSTLSALSMGGCVEDRTTFFIAGVAGFPPDEPECDLDPSLSMTQLTVGTYDPSSGAPYITWLLLANGMQTLGDNDSLRPETSRIIVEGAVVTISQGENSVDSFTIDSSGVVNPDESEDPGLAVIPIAVLPAGLGISNGDYVIRISVFGETLGGIDVETSEYAFPVTVRSGSLVACTTGVDRRGHPCAEGAAQDGFEVTCGLICGTDCE